MVWSTLGRLILVPIAFLVAAAAATFVLVTLGLERVTHAMHGRDLDLQSVGALFDITVDAWLLASSLTLLPALALVIVGEAARVRSAIYYIIGGGLALAAVPLLARIGQGQPLAMPAAAAWQVFATAGFAGGFIYWLLAGRRA